MTTPLVRDRSAVAVGATPLDALAAARERLIEASAKLQRRPGVVRVASGVDCRGYRSGSTFEAYVEAELESRQVVTWWIEITWEPTWRVAARIYRDDDDGQTIVRKFADRTTTDPDQFVRQLEGLVDEVVASIDHRGEAREQGSGSPLV
jgi:hypothetical protein